MNKLCDKFVINKLIEGMEISANVRDEDILSYLRLNLAKDLVGSTKYRLG